MKPFFRGRIIIEATDPGAHTAPNGQPCWRIASERDGVWNVEGFAFVLGALCQDFVADVDPALREQVRVELAARVVAECAAGAQGEVIAISESGTQETIEVPPNGKQH